MQIEHKTEKGTLCLVKVPDDSYGFNNETVSNQINFKVDEPFKESKLTFSECIIISKGKWQLIGLTSEVTEEQCKIMMPEFKNGHNEVGYPYYNLDGLVNDGINVAFVSALDSFKTLMQHKKVYEVNPYQEQMKAMTFCNEHKNKWELAQENVGHWIVLFKPND